MREIPLTQGKVAQVDDADYEWLMQWKWSTLNTGRGHYPYAAREQGGKVIYMHRVILGLRDREFGDHIDGSGLNNQRANLRRATNSQNLCNRKVNSNNKSGYKGVSQSGNSGKWIAKIRSGEESIYLGRFDTPMIAASAYNEAALKYHGEFARLNVIPESEPTYG